MRNQPLEEGQRWLSQAQVDLRWTRHLAEAVELAGEAVQFVGALLAD
jgi:hypothetical protein